MPQTKVRPAKPMQLDLAAVPAKVVTIRGFEYRLFEGTAAHRDLPKITFVASVWTFGKDAPVHRLTRHIGVFPDAVGILLMPLVWMRQAALYARVVQLGSHTIKIVPCTYGAQMADDNIELAFFAGETADLCKLHGLLRINPVVA